MNFSVYVDAQTGAQLAQVAARQGRTRNALITEAIKQWLANNGPTDWPRELLDAGAEDLEPFESHRPADPKRPRFP